MLPERFMSKVEVTESCWLWKASVTSGGYGRYGLAGNWVAAHRFSWEFYNGRIPNGLYILHKCDIRNCINPEHLFLGTAKDNAIDRNNKNRNFDVSGENNGRSKLTKQQVIEIRNSYRPNFVNIGKYNEFSMKGLARKYGVSSTQIKYILENKSWK